jgi:hypothetical protein
MLFLMTMLLISCSQNGEGRNEFCLIAKPIYVSNHDILTQDTARAIYTHNETGAALCGWK